MKQVILFGLALALGSMGLQAMAQEDVVSLRGHHSLIENSDTPNPKQWQPDQPPHQPRLCTTAALDPAFRRRLQDQSQV